ncbi:MAG: hypothetical protein JO163_02960 [Methylobacteriaceae bacterium]|nr:hypothetical protein [Methylobacteriaceae bacterium]MBV9217858.1 hypothetical protein [Methylobacteriaceae bacterium]MBV9636264.1 hypothetical protein [Methylobacteriaceae bacterium]MBV9701666.1 hypothetical protein [Methylobacteriaceae bacterium]
MRKTLSLVCALGLAVAAIAFDAHAMPTAPVGAAAKSGGVTTIGWRCGPYRHWAPRLGHCVHN